MRPRPTAAVKHRWRDLEKGVLDRPSRVRPSVRFVLAAGLVFSGRGINPRGLGKSLARLRKAGMVSDMLVVMMVMGMLRSYEAVLPMQINQKHIQIQSHPEPKPKPNLRFPSHYPKVPNRTPVCMCCRGLYILQPFSSIVYYSLFFLPTIMIGSGTCPSFPRCSFFGSLLVFLPPKIFLLPRLSLPLR